MTLWLVIRPSTAEASESPDDDLVPRLKGLDRLAHRRPRTSGLGLLAPDPDLRPEVRGLRSFGRTSHLHRGEVLDRFQIDAMDASPDNRPSRSSQTALRSASKTVEAKPRF